jgi:hypothetical protein
MKIVINLLNGEVDTHEATYPNDFDVRNSNGVLAIVWSRYQGEELRRKEYPLTSIRDWEYTR